MLSSPAVSLASLLRLGLIIAVSHDSGNIGECIIMCCYYDVWLLLLFCYYSCSSSLHLVSILVLVAVVAVVVIVADVVGAVQ